MRVYELASSRIKQYLKAEIDFVSGYVKEGNFALELGCGYGRVLRELAIKTGLYIGIDSSLETLSMARQYLSGHENISLIGMNAANLGFKSATFDLTICVQNGISAFHILPEILISESLRVTKPGGHVLISSYSPNIWEDRLEWFRLQSEAGLLGEIDWEKTGDAKIVCRDGFSGTAFYEAEFHRLLKPLNYKYKVLTIDNSSVFCDITV